MTDEPKPKRHFQPYTFEDKLFIKANHQTMKPEQLAKHLGRTVFSINKMKSVLRCLPGPDQNYNWAVMVANNERKRMIRTNELVTEMKDLIRQCENPEITLYKKAKLSARLIYLSNLKKII